LPARSLSQFLNTDLNVDNSKEAVKLTAIVVSEDLRYWYPPYVDASIPGYNPFVSVETWGDRIVAATGKELIVLSPDDVRGAFDKEPILTPYGAYFDRVRGVAYMVKRGLWRFV